MRWPAIFDKHAYRPRPGETRPEFLGRVAADGIPSLGYAESVRPLVWELSREVVALRAEVEGLRAELADLRSGQGQ